MHALGSQQQHNIVHEIEHDDIARGQNVVIAALASHVIGDECRQRVSHRRAQTRLQRHSQFHVRNKLIGHDHTAHRHVGRAEAVDLAVHLPATEAVSYATTTIGWCTSDYCAPVSHSIEPLSTHRFCSLPLLSPLPPLLSGKLQASLVAGEHCGRRRGAGGDLSR